MPDIPPSSYDEMPYINRSFPQTHPDRLATLARLFGMTSPDIETCRVLELGCASGDNLIPMALGLPNARFLGIDLSQRQIEQAQHTIDALRLGNIEVRQADITSVDAGYGQFDYIVCHGIYSWVPAPVREKVLAICNENLAPDGIAYISYNTYPGWRMRGMVRDMMIFHSGPVQSAPAKVQQARALLEFLATSVPADTAYSKALNEELEMLRQEPDAYLFHDHLEQVNEPVYFHQFAAAAARHGLRFLAEAEFGTMLASNFPAPIAETLRRIAPDLVRMEQYIDFMLNRTFRQTLLMHQGAAIKRRLDGQAIHGMYVVSPAKPVSPRPVLAHGVAEEFRRQRGKNLSTANAITKAALVLLWERWPLGLPFADLVTAARARLAESAGGAVDAATQERDAQFLGHELLELYARGALELRVRAPDLCLTPSERPLASPLARLQLERGGRVTNLRHEPFAPDRFGSQLLPLLDGTRDRDALVAALKVLADAGQLDLRQPNGTPRATGPLLRGMLRQALDENLSLLAKAGLLMA